jgi:chloramphenicol 3-O-phosphotransferase
MAAGQRPVLIYLYGPPAAGKLTIAESLETLTGAKLFHNHLTVNALTPVFDFRSPPFTEVLHRLRLDVFATAARSGVDVIFTNNSVWGGPHGRADFVAFAEEVQRIVTGNGGVTLFVQVVAPQAVLEHRVGNDSRRSHRKLVDVGRLGEMLATHDPAPLHPDDLVVDSSELTPADAAGRIAAELARIRG